VDAGDKQQDAHLCVFAKLYLEGKQEPVALISHVDFEDLENWVAFGSPQECIDH
jgi:hypothetical protein